MDLNDKTFLLYAMKNYTNIRCNGIEEFNEDISLIIHLKKLFTRYKVNGVLKERLILNHIISFFNVFSSSAAVKMLFFKLDDSHHSYLKTFLVFLNRCPNNIIINNEKNLNLILIDKTLLNMLNKG